MKKRKVLFAAYEAAPFLKTGGLGDVAASLPGAICGSEFEVRAMLPLVRQIGAEYRKDMEFLGSFTVPLGWRKQYCGLFSLRRGGVTWYFLDNEYYFDRDQVYGCFDDGERMAFFSKAICESFRHLPDFFPDVLHCNDWHTAVAPVFLREQYRGEPGYDAVRTVFTIHNIKFQGQYDPFVLGDILGLHECEAARNQLLWGGCVNYLAGAAAYSDRVTTVSPTYAREICTGEYGEGLESIFRRRESILSGILNGIDVKSYDPASDPALKKNYTAPEGKAACKKALQKELGLNEEPDTPLFAAVSRLTEQKGFDLVDSVAEELLSVGQLVILGTGDSRFEEGYRALAKRYPGRCSAQILFSEPLSRRIYAGADVFLMPSRFEPCGLSQMIAMRYGTIPVVRETGGLADSVVPYNRYTGEGTGFGFRGYSAEELRNTVREAYMLYASDKKAWRALQEQAMACDFSWNASAEKYKELYRSLLK